MSPQIADRFAGHFSQGDPRGQLSAAGGCHWPTTPAYRYRLISDDATGDLAFFNTEPVVLQFASAQPGHNVGVWLLIVPNDNVVFAAAVKTFAPRASFYNWSISVGIVTLPEEVLAFNFNRNNERCNRDLPLPNVFAFDIDRGVTGDTFRMEQIEWDRVAPRDP